MYRANIACLCDLTLAAGRDRRVGTARRAGFSLSLGVVCRNLRMADYYRAPLIRRLSRATSWSIRPRVLIAYVNLAAACDDDGHRPRAARHQGVPRDCSLH
jgi:hypothetical protein